MAMSLVILLAMYMPLVHMDTHLQEGELNTTLDTMAMKYQGHTSTLVLHTIITGQLELGRLTSHTLTTVHTYMHSQCV